MAKLLVALNFAQAVRYYKTLQPPDAEEQRTVLASLKGHGRLQKVSSIRVGSVVKATEPGVLPVSSSDRKSNSASSSKGFVIFQVSFS